MSTLKENYKNDVLDPLMNGKRKYEKTDNADGTLSLTDKTSYTQVGDNFGADDINAITHEINQINNNLTNLKLKKLWENPNDTKSAFASQTITLSSSNYDVLIIVTTQYKSNEVSVTNFIPKGLSCSLSSAINSSTTVWVYQRGITYIDDTHYSFTDGLYGSTSTNRTVNNNSIVPIVIYGLKL